MSIVTKIIAPVLFVVTSSAALADAPAWVKIGLPTYAGSGCPAGSVAENLAPDFQAFTLLFDSFVAEVGPTVPFSQKRKNCQLNIPLSFPPGWSYAVMTVDYRGYVSLQPKVNAVQQSSYYFQGSTQTARLRTVMTGPADRDYQIRDTLGLATVVWSPCGALRSLNINAEVRLDNSAAPNNAGMITLDSIDGAIKQVYGIVWRRCP